ncbi:MAG: hypothetical protein E6167_05815 [Varibaculum cambriense]|uniref:Bacteriocin cerein 7B domain protein n=1 Tax=Varibaculum cambriense TaxID=184870 RepID=A0AB34X0V4_9ACTO|nr:hypothetical protein [Varibaculum cambriense]KXB81180.1 bacteriocin cerein 7B domain protein [Varibaculum cambriense]MDK8275270.1 hypothetical protein [Varibaculum cambriense]MDU5268113.1 hypothetical protein [Varibaculum cambriense]MDU5308374.1 hypothetical protein [Varibaculum cambriense]MDU6680382.1 hypothetical protein [Varibaculum cambriense]
MTFPLSGLVAGVVAALGMAGVGGLEGALALGEEVAVLGVDGEGTVPGVAAGLQAVRVKDPTLINPKIASIILSRLRG